MIAVESVGMAARPSRLAVATPSTPSSVRMNTARSARRRIPSGMFTSPMGRVSSYS